MRPECLCTRFLSLAMAAAFVLTCVLSATGNELGELLVSAERNNPLLQMARQQIRQAVASRDELASHLDPQIMAGIGGGRDIQAISVGHDYKSPGGDNLGASAGVMIPVEEAGAYVSMGGAARRVFDAGDYDDYYQASCGLRVEVPLLRDRGFALLDFKRRQALAAFNAAMGNYAVVAQKLRHDIEQAYISVFEARKALDNAEEATRRFKKFHEDAAKMVQLRAIAEYQLANAELEMQLGREDEQIAANVCIQRLLVLENLVCPEDGLELAAPNDCLVQEADNLEALPEIPAEIDFAHRGEILVVQAEIDVLYAQLAHVREEGKDDLSLNAGVSWNGEGKSSPLEMRRLTGENHVGAEVMLSWNRPLGYYGNKAAEERLLAMIAEKEASLRNIRNQLLMTLRAAQENFRSARRRFDILKQGVDAANKTVEAEHKRFNQGECTSNDVLDAQKKLTNIFQRLNAAAADMLRAESDFRYAMGYSLSN